GAPVMLRAMNRQLRRAQAKMDKKAEIEKEKRKQARREKVQEARERRKRMREDAKSRAASGAPAPAPAARREYTPEERKRLPGRFSGAFMFATVFFIALQAAVPADEKELGQSLIGAGF